MLNVIYKKTLIPAAKAPDGETPTILFLTEEANGLAMICEGFDSTELVRWFPKYRRDEAIEATVEKGKGLEEIYRSKGALMGELRSDDLSAMGDALHALRVDCGKRTDERDQARKERDDAVELLRRQAAKRDEAASRAKLYDHPIGRELARVQAEIDADVCAFLSRLDAKGTR